MPSFSAELPFDHARPKRIGVLITNLGTPDAPTAAATRRYLAEFLADPRVIEQPRWLWRIILHGIVLRIRPSRSARAYAEVWTEAGSPLLIHSKAIADGLERRWQERHPDQVAVALGMRYGKPSIPEALHRLRASGAGERIFALPLYPHYSGATVGSTFDRITDVLRRWRRTPAFRFVDHYHDHPLWIDAIAESIRKYHLQGKPDRLLFSFHGLPRRYLDAGDPYHCECHKSARLIAERLGLEADTWHVAFQSRVGKGEWLRPWTDEVLQGWGKEGVERVDVICPGFAADCLETLEEIALRGRDSFVSNGGGELRYIPALNADKSHIEALGRLVEDAIPDWLATPQDDLGTLAASAERARALGAKN
ncbi:MAG: ferrochelatase [Ectothiorhodospiraceae bacterium AqS1]|nr:ferrochelatase [Ectothiorhodospiraceae bacterium AqS1]